MPLSNFSAGCRYLGFRKKTAGTIKIMIIPVLGSQVENSAALVDVVHLLDDDLVILSKLTKAPPPRRRRRKVSAARRRSRNPVHTLKGPRSQYLTRGRPARAATSSTTTATSPVARKLLIHAQNKGTRARAFRGVAVSPLVSGG